MAQLTGHALVGRSKGDETQRRANALQAMLVGLMLLMLPWLIASAMAWSPAGGLVMRTIALAVTWVAGSAGLGGALLSRGGVKRARSAAAGQAMSGSGWATPTPVSGVAVAKRPTPPSSTESPR
jgi:hypothetical protein